MFALLCARGGGLSRPEDVRRCAFLMPVHRQRRVSRKLEPACNRLFPAIGGPSPSHLNCVRCPLNGLLNQAVEMCRATCSSIVSSGIGRTNAGRQRRGPNRSARLGVTCYWMCLHAGRADHSLPSSRLGRAIVWSPGCCPRPIVARCRCSFSATALRTRRSSA